MEWFKTGKKKRRSKKGMKEAFGDDFVSQFKFMDLQQEERDVEHLKSEVTRLTLVCRALWSFIKEHHGLSEADLTDRLDQMKQQEGEICTQCGRVITRSQKRCLYCGAEGQEKDLSF